MLGKLRRITARLPGVTVVRDGFGHSTFKVRKKSFVLLGINERGPDLAIKSDPVTQEMLVRSGPWYVTPYIGHHGWVSADGEDLDWSEVAELVLDGYRLAAPRALVRRFRDDGPGPIGNRP